MTNWGTNWGPPTVPPPDPAYADQAADQAADQEANQARAPYGPYAPTYGGYTPQWAPNLNETSQTRRLPPYWQQDQPPPGGQPPGQPTPPAPERPRSPRWLWVAAGAAVLLCVAMVVALVLANGAIKTQTAVPPLPAMPSPIPTVPHPPTRPPIRTPAPTAAPPTIGGPTEPTTPGGLQSVVYNVAGEGRAISIVYIDTGDVIGTEFNVALPWSKEVSLSPSAVHPASVTVVNIGHNVTCSLSVGGVQMRQRVGVGLTVCDTRG
jgi:hypothetical protein